MSSDNFFLLFLTVSAQADTGAGGCGGQGAPEPQQQPWEPGGDQADGEDSLQRNS